MLKHTWRKLRNYDHLECKYVHLIKRHIELCQQYLVEKAAREQAEDQLEQLKQQLETNEHTQ